MNFRRSRRKKRKNRRMRRKRSRRRRRGGGKPRRLWRSKTRVTLSRVGAAEGGGVQKSAPALAAGSDKT